MWGLWHFYPESGVPIYGVEFECGHCKNTYTYLITRSEANNIIQMKKDTHLILLCENCKYEDVEYSGEYTFLRVHAIRRRVPQKLKRKTQRKLDILKSEESRISFSIAKMENLIEIAEARKKELERKYSKAKLYMEMMKDLEA